MVLQRELPLPREGEPDNTYWAIGGCMATVRSKRRVDYTPTPLSGPEQDVRNDRKDRGLLNYYNCTIRELREFINARGIVLHKGAVRKPMLIKTLEDAEDEIKFNKLFELAPELRQKIYREYFDALPDLPALPHQPPLTLASSAVRAESLPLYYSNATFSLTFFTNARALDFLLLNKKMQTCISSSTRALNEAHQRPGLLSHPPPPPRALRG